MVSNHIFHHFLFAFLLCGFAAAFSAPALCGLPACSTSNLAPAETNHTQIGTAWSGTRVSFDAVRVGEDLIVGYYNGNRQLTVATIRVSTGEESQQQLPIWFDGWDSHKSIALGVDKDHGLHVVANTHASPLSYFYSPYPGQPFVKSRMTGRHENAVTYPQFIQDSANETFFIYRSGGSGDGAWVANEWSGREWQAVSQKPIFGSRGFGTTVSSYPSEFVRSEDGYFHVLITWRLTPDASTNVGLSYAKTKNFRDWFDSKDYPLKTPLTPETAELVLETGVNSGLLDARLSIEKNGRPVAVFSQYDEAGNNVIDIAYPDAKGWSRQRLIDGTEHAAIQGTGSIAFPIVVSPIDFGEHDPTFRYRLPGVPAQALALNAGSLTPKCRLSLAVPNIPIRIPVGLARASIQREAVRAWPRAYLAWYAQEANQDSARRCTKAALLACDPPASPLLLLTPK